MTGFCNIRCDLNTRDTKFDRWEIVFYLTIILVASALRLWDLGFRAVGYDESLHAFYSYQLYQGEGFQHTPLMHGPFQFHGIALSFLLFGDNDYTFRLLHALFGIGLVFLPILLRDRLGKFGSLATSAMIAFSPVLIYYSRYARNDIFMVFWTAALVIFMWKYIDEGKSRYIYLSSITLALAFATKETTFLSVFIICSYLIVISSTDWITWLIRKPSLGSSKDLTVDMTATLEYRYWPGYGYLYGEPLLRHTLAKFSNTGSFLILLVTLTVPQISAVFSVFQKYVVDNGVILANTSGAIGAPAGDLLFSIGELSITKGIILAAIILIMLLGLSVTVGVRWDRILWLRAAGLFYITWMLLFTTFLTNFVGFGSGIWQSLGYWIVQHGERRGDQPWYYYLIIAPWYETLPFVLSLISVIIFVIKGNKFTRFLAYWVVVTFILYSWAGEKMPWLLVNISVPMIFASGKLIDITINSINWKKLRLIWSIQAVLASLACIWLLVLYLVSENNWLNQDLRFLSIGLVAMLLGYLYFILSRKLSPGTGLKLVMMTISCIMLVFGLRLGWNISYTSTNTPGELIVYAQGSAEARDVIDDINEIAEKSGGVSEFGLSVDRDTYWGLLWYIREYDNVSYLDTSDLSNEPYGSVLLVSENSQKFSDKYRDQYTSNQEFMYLWWPSEWYKPCGVYRFQGCLNVSNVADAVSKKSNWRDLLHLYWHRDLSAPVLSHNAEVHYD